MIAKSADCVAIRTVTPTKNTDNTNVLSVFFSKYGTKIRISILLMQEIPRVTCATL